MGKGSKRERELKDMYHEARYAVYRPATVKFGENDPFGLFDLICMSPGDKHVHAVQVKSNRASGINAWTRHTQLFRRFGWETLYGVPYDREGWRIIRCGSTQDAGGRYSREDLIDERGTGLNMGDGVIEWLKERNGTVGWDDDTRQTEIPQ